MTTIVTIECAGGCGTQVDHEPATGDSIFARFANRVPVFCPACDERREREIQEERERLEARQAEHEARQRITGAGLPAGLRSVSLEGLDRDGCEQAIEHARRWAARELAGLMLTGPFGTGKTTIAAGALVKLLATHPGRWASAPMLMARLGSGLGSQQREWAIDLMEARRALVIDDLDKTRPTEYGAEQIFLAVDNAVTRGQQLLVTTNLSPDQLAAKWPAPYGDAIVSRLVGYCSTVVVDGADRRLAGGTP